jgi:hypothetical protein
MEGLRYNQTINEIRITEYMNSDKMILLFNALRYNRTVETLELGKLCYYKMEDLIEMLRHNYTLRKITSNRITDKYKTIIDNLLFRNKIRDKVRTLYLINTMKDKPICKYILMKVIWYYTDNLKIEKINNR